MCAVIRRGILGGFSNKIGNIVGTSWKGIAIMKSLPLSVANPRTTAQTNQRQTFSAASKTGSILLATVIKPLWDRFAQQESGYNAFIQSNMLYFDVIGFHVPDDFVMSKGKMAAVTPLTASRDISTGVVTITWPTSLPDAFSNTTDKVYITILDFDTVYAKGFSTAAVRSAGTVTVATTAALIMSAPIVYIAFARADGTVVSNTGFLTVTQIP